jgi:DNA-binding transcriptional regulator YhcF (GntR family)
MTNLIEEGKPIFQQIAERIEDDIISGTLPEESQAPSTNQFAAFYHINPATAAKGVNLLVEQGILYKKRGIGMFVSTGAKQAIIAKRQEQFYEQFVQAMLTEAKKLNIGRDQLIEMIQRKG